MKQKIRTASLLLLMVLGIGLVLMACGTKSLADSRTADSDSYGLNAESMTGIDSCQMELQEGEMLVVHFETVRGSMCMEIQAPDGSPLYAELEKLLSRHGFRIYDWLAPCNIQTRIIESVGANLKAFEHVNYCLAVRKG